MKELWRLTAAELADGYRRGAFTPVDATHACLARARHCQPSTHAFIHLDDTGALAAASDSAGRWSRGQPLSPLDGVPVSLKDNLHAQGWPTTWGSQLLRGFVAPRDELPVARVRAAGAVLFGKTNLPEFAMHGITDNRIAATTRNPWDLALTPGGSSGGAAAAVASGCGPLALVTDGGGSTRRPASHTGLVGFKAGDGLVARGGGLPEIFLGFEVPGVLARSVHDAASLAAVLSGRELATTLPASARILHIRQFGQAPVDPAIAGAVDAAAAHWRALGHSVETAKSVDWADAVNACWPLVSSAGLAWLLDNAWRFPEFGLDAGGQPDLALCTDTARSNIALGGKARATELFDALQAVHVLNQTLASVFGAYDFLLTPATAALPWGVTASHPATIAGQAAGPRGHAVFTAFANAAGLPAIALPAGWVDGLPTGFQLVGPPGSDAVLLALAAQYEQAHPWRDRWPPDPTRCAGAA